jgi:hypothetical protein
LISSRETDRDLLLRFTPGSGLTKTISPEPRENPLRDDRSGGPLIDPAYFLNFGSVRFRFFMLPDPSPEDVLS